MATRPKSLSRVIRLKIVYEIHFFYTEKMPRLIKILISVFFILMRIALITILLTPSPRFLIMWLVILSFYLGLILRKILSSWVIYSIVLLFTGGIMVLFMYILTLVSSIKVLFFQARGKLSILVISVVVICFFTPNELNREVNLSNIFIINTRSYILLLASYLFIVLLAVVKLSETYKGPIKSTFNYEKK
jgi:hypothetical protein